MELSSHFANLTSLEKLVFNDCNIGNKGAAALLESALKASKTFSTFVVSNNRIGDKIIPLLTKLVENQPSLSTLDLSGNNLEIKGIEAVMKLVETNAKYVVL